MKRQESKRLTKKRLEKLCFNFMLSNFKETYNKELKKLIDSGGIDLTKWDSESYTPAKALVSVCLINCAAEFSPLSTEGKAIVNNLKKF